MGHQMEIFDLMLKAFINFFPSVFIPSNSSARNVGHLLKSSLFDYT